MNTNVSIVGDDYGLYSKVDADFDWRWKVWTIATDILQYILIEFIQYISSMHKHIFMYLQNIWSFRLITTKINMWNKTMN